MKLTNDQVEDVISWMSEWEQLKDTVIPIRFREHFINHEDINQKSDAIEFARWIAEETHFRPTKNQNEWAALHLSEGWHTVSTERLYEMFKDGNNYC